MKNHTTCFFNSCKSWGGGEKWHFEIAKWANESGYDVIVIAQKKSELYKKIKSETSIKCYGIKLNNRSFLNPFKYTSISNILKSNNVGTIIMCLPIDVKVAGIAAKSIGIKNRVYRRGSAIAISNTFSNRYLFKHIVTDVIANSYETKETILRNNPFLFPESRIKVIYNGVDIKEYDLKPTNKISIPGAEGKVILGNAGRLEDQKNHIALLHVAEKLIAKGVEFKLVIAGSGTKKEALYDYIVEKNLEDYVQLIGFVDNIKDFMESIDIFLLSSKWEGFGFVLAEAMAAKKPVVAFNISSNPELIVNEQTGYLVPAFDENSYAEKVALLINDKQKRLELGNSGRIKLEREFSLSQTQEILAEFFNKLNLSNKSVIEKARNIKLSVAIITLNEERNIERCLSSVKDIADEIIVVDSYSTDKTEEICTRYNAKFIKNKFEGHIQQKNFAVSLCSYDYVLSLDADEALSDELKQSIRKIKIEWNSDGYYFNRRNHYCGKWIRHGAWYPDHSLRVWDRRKGQWGGLNPHDKFIMQPGSVKKYLHGDLLHYSYYSLEEHVLQSNKFSTISARSKYNSGIRSSTFKVWFYPKFRFFRDYFIKFGFLDGLYGYIVCKNNSHEVFLKYTKLLMLQKSEKKVTHCQGTNNCEC